MRLARLLGLLQLAGRISGTETVRVPRSAAGTIRPAGSSKPGGARALRLLPIAAMSAAALAGCNNLNLGFLGLGGATGAQSLVIGNPSDLEIAEVAKFLAPDGKSKVMGSAKLPQLQPGGRTTQSTHASAAGAKVEVLDGEGKPTGIEATADQDGLFSLEGVPTGHTAIIKVTTVKDGKTATMRKLTRPTEALQCVKVDVASTMVADKILSKVSPLSKPDAPLEGAPLVDLFKPEKVDALEETIRKGLQFDDEGQQQIETILTDANGDASKLFDLIVREAPLLVDVYHEVFERPDSAIAIRIKAIGTNHNQQRKRAISGVLRMQLQGVKAGTLAVEFWFSSPVRTKWGEASAANDFTVTLDTWKYTDGTYTMESVLAGADGKRKMLGKISIDIVNDVAAHCGS